MSIQTTYTQALDNVFSLIEALMFNEKTRVHKFAIREAGKLKRSQRVSPGDRFR